VRLGRGLTSIWWSPVRLLLPLFLGLDLVLLAYGADSWRGRWLHTFDWLGSDTILLGPVVAAMAAWLAWRDRVQLADVIRAERRRDGSVGRFALTGLVAVAAFAHVTTLAIACIITWHIAGPPTGAPYVVSMSAVAGFALYAGLGYLAGLLVRSPAAPAVAAVVVFSIPVVSLTGILGTWVPTLVWSHGGGTGFADDLVPRISVILAQTVLGVGICMVAASLAPAAGPWLRSVSWFGVLVGGLAAVLGFGFLKTTDQVAFAEPDQAVVVHCRGQDPQVCLAAGHDTAAAQLATWLTRIRAVYTQVGVRWDVRRVVEVSAGQYRRDAATTGSSTRLLGIPEALRPDGADLGLLVDQLVLPTPCRGTDAYLAIGGTDSAQATLDWLASAASGRPAAQSGSPFVGVLVAVSPGRRAAFLRQDLEAFARCDGTRLASLP